MSELQGMILNKLEVERKTWGAEKGQFRGTITFEGEHGIITTKLNPEQCAKMFAVVADGVIDTAREVAQELKRECMIGYAKPAELITAEAKP